MTVGELIQRLEHFPPEFSVVARLSATDLRVVAPLEVRMDLTNPATLQALADYERLPDGYTDSVVLFPYALDDDGEPIADA